MFRRQRCIRLLPKSVPYFILTMLILVVLVLTPNQLRLRLFGTEISCYHYQNLPTLPELQPTSAQSIFFHETSCASHLAGRIVINSRQACAVESAAILHPNRQIYLQFTSPGRLELGIGDDSDLAINALLTYGNIHLGHINFEKYLNNTPLENLYRNGAIERSTYAGSHASDILRYLTLWKYGGVYLDLDVVVMKNFDDLGENFAGSESKLNVAAGVLSLSVDEDGHKFAERCLSDLSANFNGDQWGYNGPGVITRLVRQLCELSANDDVLTRENCGGFQIKSPRYFYPIPWWNWTAYFDMTQSDQVMKLVEDSYVIHVWNKHSRTAQVVKDSAYARIARRFCPKVYTALTDREF